MNKPLVSCLCVTEGRVAFLKRAINCFNHQSYDNKELVILFKDYDSETRDYVNGTQSDVIKGYSVSDETMSLGALRNLAIESATGDFFCQWDDDDWYHSQRIEKQMNAAYECRKDGSVLMNLLMYDVVERCAYFSFPRPWENSILCRRSLFLQGYKYPDLSKQEDTVFVNSLLMNNKLTGVFSSPTYVYVYHRNNTWGSDHFTHLFSNSQKLSDGSSETIRRILTDEEDFSTASEKLSSDSFVRELNFMSTIRIM